MEMETGVGEHGEGMGRKPASYEDLEALPPHVVGEIIAGELYVSPRPASLHARACARLAMLMAPFDLGERGPGGWVILFEPELHFGQDVLVPDLAGWRHERMPVFPRTAAFTLAPDWACEVRSPSTATLDRKGKPPVYARAGVNHLWLLDPEERTLEVFQLGGERYEPLGTYRGDIRVRATPLEAIELNLALLWA